ncbi:complex I NDUFA9 subunit family protein [Candidatus Pelagibacter sp.]|nr:complex I NDUFA9 subunit family protein [Candidatus Pelagibacter sp.]
MKAKNCLIFGGSGQIGRNLIRKLAKNNYTITVVTRNIHQKSYIIKTQANAGFIEIVEANIFEEKKIRELFKKSDICINLIGILFEQKKGNTFKNIHSIFPSLLAKLSKEYNLKHFIHLSALGINEAIDSKYAESKLQGEEKILKNFPLATILRPSVVYSVDDNFTTNFMTLLNRLPLFPIYYNGTTKFAPIHCSDLTDIIHYVISKNIYSKIIECVGPEVISFKQIIEKLLNLIGKKRILIPLPLPIAELSARFFEIMPKPLLTRDQLKLLRYDNISSGKYKTNFDIGIPSLKYFDQEVKKYCYMWRDGGQFSTEKYSSKNLDDDHKKNLS